jgi:non-lysosomal glucosylceramidase
VSTKNSDNSFKPAPRAATSRGRFERRSFLQTLAIGSASAVDFGAATNPLSAAPETPSHPPSVPGLDPLPALQYPRRYTGRQLSQIAFPLGGIGTGSISLGGRGQLRDWEIFNRPDKGLAPDYAFAAIWARSGTAKPMARVLESRVLAPYSSEAGLGPNGAPGLARLRGARFTGEFPFAHIDFDDDQLPVAVSLEAFSPFIPLDGESSGYPVIVMRYRVRNPRPQKASVSIAFSIENPIGLERLNPTRRNEKESRMIEFRREGSLQGLFMTNPGIDQKSPLHGSFALTLAESSESGFSYLRGWPDAKWWASPMLFWDDFSDDGRLGPEASKLRPYGALCLNREIESGSEATYTFLLSWHFPNRTPGWSGWDAPEGHKDDVIGNHYCQRFTDAWAAASSLAASLPKLEARSRAFVKVMSDSTLPAGLCDAAMANVSTLVTQTCFRTADGEFHGFEGCDDHRGCCFGNCTHVWNYESTTQHVFPALARSLRKSAFGFSEDEQGGMRHRQMLPDGIERYSYAAADGQMGQIIKLYLDWRLSGDTEWLRPYWPKVKRAISFAWIPGGWDPDRDGVLEGVQHNTYDVEFYGPNPLCGIYYLGALRAAEEMALVLGENDDAQTYRKLFTNGSRWIDANLFNGEYYFQEVRSIPKDKIAPSTVSGMGSERSEEPEFQLGKGCLADQLIGQYQADLAGLGPLLDPAKMRITLASIYKYNYRPNLMEHDSVQRVYALNDEPAVLVCDYGRGERPRIPFPYYAEAWTGIEYLVASQMIFAGMVEQGIRCIDNVRRRFDGERRNPWDEPECGHHYARAMSAWSGVLALGGFSYHGGTRTVTARPRVNTLPFRCIWSAANGWGLFSYSGPKGATFRLSAVEGFLSVKSVALRNGASGSAVVKINNRVVPAAFSGPSGVLALSEEITVKPGEDLLIQRG